MTEAGARSRGDPMIVETPRTRSVDLGALVLLASSLVHYQNHHARNGAPADLVMAQRVAEHEDVRRLLAQLRGEGLVPAARTPRKRR